MQDDRESKSLLIENLHQLRQRIDELESLCRKQENIENNLRRDADFFRDLVENTSDWIWETDAQHRLIYTNMRVKDVLGYEPDEVLGKPPTWCMKEEELKRIGALLDELHGLPRPVYGLECELISKDGSSHILEFNLVPTYTAAGDFAGFRGTSRDITGRMLAEQSLQRSEERFLLVSQAANDFIYDWDLVSGKAWLSEAHRTFLGFTGNEDYASWWTERVHPADRERILSGLRAIMADGKDVWMDEYRFLCAEGYYLDILDRGQIIRDEQHTPVRIIGSMMNITAQKRAEAALRESEENYRHLIQNSPFGIIVYDCEGKIIMSNSRALEILDLTEERIMGKPAYYPEWKFLRGDGSLLPPEEHPALKVIADHQPVTDMLYGVVRPGESEIGWYLVSAQPQLDPRGRLQRVIFTFIDVTIRIRALEALRVSEAKYRFLTEKMNEVVWTTDNHHLFTYISPSVQQTLGYVPEELLSRQTSTILTPESYAATLDVLEKHIRTDESEGIDPHRSSTLEAAFLHKNGTIVWVETVTAPIRNDQGDVIGWHGVSRDITEKRRAASEREELIEELKKALSEVKTLSGMLPICSNCKKIRDDQGYWNQIENYLSQHSEALFSHSICPECAQKLYPETFARKKKKLME